MEAPYHDEAQRRRSAIRAAFEQVTRRPRARLSPTVSIPTVLLDGLGADR